MHILKLPEADSGHEIIKWLPFLAFGVSVAERSLNYEDKVFLGNQQEVYETSQR